MSYYEMLNTKAVSNKETNILQNCKLFGTDCAKIPKHVMNLEKVTLYCHQ